MNKDTLILVYFILAVYELCIIATYDFPPSTKECSEYKTQKRCSLKCECAWRKTPDNKKGLSGDSNMCISMRYCEDIYKGFYEISPQTEECEEYIYVRNIHIGFYVGYSITFLYLAFFP
jgi:hypothetical protein